MKARSFLKGVSFILAALLVAPSFCLATGQLACEDGTGTLFEIRDHAAHVMIHDGIAITHVTQVFHNVETRPADALYAFSLPPHASVSNFSIWVNGREMIGEVIAQQVVREVYRGQAAREKSPGMLQERDGRTFELRIARIEGAADLRIDLTYQQELEVVHGKTTFTYSLAGSVPQFTGSRSEGHFSIVIDASEDTAVSRWNCPSHPSQMSITRFSDRYARGTLEAQGAATNRDVTLTYQVFPTAETVRLTTSRTAGEDGYFCLGLSADPSLPEPPIDHAFLLDVSGSMNDDGKLPQAKLTLQALIDRLPTGDRFNVIAFNTKALTLFPSMASAGGSNREKARALIESLRGEGRTDFNAGLSAAYGCAASDRPLAIVVFSDGLAEADELPEMTRRIAGRPAGSSIYCIGVGQDADRATLTRAADAAGGVAVFISDSDPIRCADELQGRLAVPVVRQVSLRFSGADVSDLEPPGPVDLFHGRPTRIYGRYREGGTLQCRARGLAQAAPYERLLSLNFPPQDDRTPEIERMWAQKRIDRLLNSSRGLNDAAIDEVVGLGERFAIVSPYTAFIALENNAEYVRWKIARHNVFRVARDRDAQSALERQLQSLRQQSPNEINVPGGVVRMAGATNTPSLVSQGNRSPAGADRLGGRPPGAGLIDPASAGAILGLLILLGLKSIRAKGPRCHGR